ncbi:aldo/keto reductase, partial [Fructobacillus ficulneus]
MLNETYKLANGVLLPKLGFGTWLLDDQAVVPAVKQALDLGYRHIDTAAVYGNEAGVGQAIRESSVAREDIFVTTKILAEIKDYDGAVAAVDESLD